MLPSIITTITTISVLSLIPFKDITPKVLAEHEISLNDRYPVESVNEVFKDNILLNLSYLKGMQKSNSVNFDEVKKPFTYQFKLNPGEVFTFHDDILPQFQGKVVRNTNAHFNSMEGFKSDGYLVGDGVCHLASLMYWVAKDAGLETLAPTNHDFMPIPGISKEYGVAIYNNPYTKGSNAQQNLYITNNQDKPVTFKFNYQNEVLKLSVSE